MKTTMGRLRALIREAMQTVQPAPNSDPSCPECRGTGIYTGLGTREPCSLCTQRGAGVETKKASVKTLPSMPKFPPLPPQKQGSFRIFVMNGIREFDVFDIDGNGKKNLQGEMNVSDYFPDLYNWLDQGASKRYAIDAVTDWLMNFADQQSAQIKDDAHPSGTYLQPREWREWLDAVKDQQD